MLCNQANAPPVSSVSLPSLTLAILSLSLWRLAAVSSLSEKSFGSTKRDESKSGFRSDRDAIIDKCFSALLCKHPTPPPLDALLFFSGRHFIFLQRKKRPYHFLREEEKRQNSISGDLTKACVYVRVCITAATSK